MVESRAKIALKNGPGESATAEVPMGLSLSRKQTRKQAVWRDREAGPETDVQTMGKGGLYGTSVLQEWVASE